MRLTKAITRSQANNFQAVGDAPHPPPRSISGAANTSCTVPAATPEAPHGVRSLTRPQGPHELHSRPHLHREGSSRHNSRCRRAAGAAPTQSRASMNSRCILDVPGLRKVHLAENSQSLQAFTMADGNETNLVAADCRNALAGLMQHVRLVVQAQCTPPRYWRRDHCGNSAVLNDRRWSA